MSEHTHMFCVVLSQEYGSLRSLALFTMSYLSLIGTLPVWSWEECRRSSACRHTLANSMTCISFCTIACVHGHFSRAQGEHWFAVQSRTISHDLRHGNHRHGALVVLCLIGCLQIRLRITGVCRSHPRITRISAAIAESRPQRQRPVCPRLLCVDSAKIVIHWLQPSSRHHLHLCRCRRRVAEIFAHKPL